MCETLAKKKFFIVEIQYFFSIINYFNKILELALCSQFSPRVSYKIRYN